MKRNTIHILPIMAVILVMAAIFLFSSQPVVQSDRLSRGLAELIINLAKHILPGWNVDVVGFHHLLRKGAHFFLYFLLGVLGANAFRKNGLTMNSSAIAALFLCTLFALSDEAHQLFVSGRGAQLKDVALDSVGAAVGIILLMIASGLRKKS